MVSSVVVGSMVGGGIFSLPQNIAARADVGAVLIGIGIVFTVVQFVTSYIKRKDNVDVTGDPWDGRTLEWATSSPPPFYNFAVIPTADKIDAFYEAKKNGVELVVDSSVTASPQ